MYYFLNYTNRHFRKLIIEDHISLRSMLLSYRGVLTKSNIYPVARLYDCLLLLLTCLWFGCAPDENVRKYWERLQQNPEPPVQVNQVDSCFHGTLEKVGLTLYDDPEGQYCTIIKCFLF